MAETPTERRRAADQQLERLGRVLGLSLVILGAAGTLFGAWLKLENVDRDRKIAHLEWKLDAAEKKVAALESDAKDAARTINGFAVLLERAVRSSR